MLHLVDNILQAIHRSDSIVVGTFGNNDNIIISNIVIIRTFGISTRCKYPKILISEIYIPLVIFIIFGKIYMKHFRKSKKINLRKRILDFMI